MQCGCKSLTLLRAIQVRPACFPAQPPQLTSRDLVREEEDRVEVAVAEPGLHAAVGPGPGLVGQRHRLARGQVLHRRHAVA